MKIKIFIIIIILLAASRAYALRSESENEVTFTLGIPQGMTIVKTFSAHCESGPTYGLPDDVEHHKSEFGQVWDISGDSYYCRSGSIEGELSSVARVINSERYAYALSIVFYDFFPDDNYIISFEGEFTCLIECKSETDWTNTFSSSAYSIWIGTIEHYEGPWDIFTQHYIDEVIQWHEILGAENYDDDGKSKFKFKNFDLLGLGESSRYVLLFISDAYVHTFTQYRDSAANRGFSDRHKNVLRHVENEVVGRDKNGCFVNSTNKGVNNGRNNF